MKHRRYYMITGLILVIGVGITLTLGKEDVTKDPRSAYEQYLRSEYDKFPYHSSPEAKDEEPAGMDRPDLAAFNEYMKTVDPKLKAVPRERLIPAYLTTEALQRTKSGGKELAWTHHVTDMGGRARAMMFDPNDPTHSKVWAGAVTGGLWVSEDPFHQMPWQPVDDFWPNLAISCIASDPNSPQDFYVGTGESQTAVIIYRESSGRGTGIMHSSDGGQTWHLIPSTTRWAYVTDILVRDEGGESVIYAGVISGLYKGILHQSDPSDGLYRSTDHGTTWTQVLPLVPGTDRPYPPSDIETSADGKRIFVGTTYHGQDWNGAGCVLYSDNGTDWTAYTDFATKLHARHPIPSTTLTADRPGRIMLASAPSNPNMVFALVAGGYVRSDGFIGYDCAIMAKSADKGVTWSDNLAIPLRSGSNTFAYLAWHALVIAVDPVDPNVLWVGGLDTWRSLDGGQNWNIMSDWAQMYGNGSPRYVHADIHYIGYRPGSNQQMIIATDGGIFGTADATQALPTFVEYNKAFSTLQYYSGAIHPAAGTIHFIGGLQDNGTMFYKKGDTPTFTDMLSGGDGALCFIDEDEPSIQITTVYHNSLYLYSGPAETQPQSRRSRGLGSGMFVNAMDYNSRDNILFANGMREEGTYGNTLEIVNVTPTDLTPQARKNLATNSDVPYTNLKWSPHSPAGASTLFIGTQAGKIFRLGNALGMTSAAQGLTELTPTEFPTAYISCIDIAQSEDTLLVTFSNYGVASVWLTTDGGANWRNVEGNLPDMPIRWGIFHPMNGHQVMLATETGSWTTLNITADPVVWSPDLHGMANVRIDQLKFRKSDNTVLAATHGRGMYTAVWEPNYVSSVGHIVLEEQEIKVFPNPSNGRFDIALNGKGKYQVTILDLSGRILIDQSFDHEGFVRRSFDLTTEPRGTYLVRVLSDGQVTTKKVLVY